MVKLLGNLDLLHHSGIYENASTYKRRIKESYITTGGETFSPQAESTETGRGRRVLIYIFRMIQALKAMEVLLCSLWVLVILPAKKGYLFLSPV
jgi:hypothetical protein